ncbi:MAG: Hsp70 family protein [Akkermansiaceae bacterium]
MTETILGIDLGTTQSAVAVMDSGFPILLANAEGESLTPSAVWYGGNGEVEVGTKALRRKGISPVVTSVKSLIGRRLSEVAEQAGLVEEEGRLHLKTAVGLKVPEEVSSEVLKELKAIAETRLEKEVTQAVITVPAYFHDGQRAATKKAGELAGLEVVRILSEPTAAALSYGLNRLDDSMKVAVFDLGGGTFDVSILEMREGVFEVLATAGDTCLGGDDFDRVIVEESLAELGIENSEELEMAVFHQEARRVKHVLSEKTEATFRVPFKGEVQWSRCRFDEQMKSYLASMESCCRRAMLDAGVTSNELETVLMVGGSSRIPIVRDRVEAVFEKEPDLSQHPDEAIARGASIQAGILSGAIREVVLLDVTPLSLGVETMGGLMNILIPRNTTIPCKAGEMFTNAVDQQAAMKVRVLQGERELAGDNWELGSFEVNFEPACKGQARVGVEFRIDANGILSVLARDVTTGKDVVIEVGSAAVDVTEAKVEKMVSESVEHAFEDMNARVFEEARLKAEELLPAVDLAVAQAGEFLNDVELAKIREAQGAVQAALETGQAGQLKGAVEKLDAETEVLAAELIEKATKALFSPS